MLVSDKFDELVGSHTGLFSERETFRKELDKAQFERVADESMWLV
jgi:hypothetical protein